MSYSNQAFKRIFDIIVSMIGLILTGPVILIAIIVSRWETGSSGIFRQTRVGLCGRPFQLYKIRTMRELDDITTTVTRRTDPRITRFGGLLRRTKIDELPQLFNVLRGEMSLVGPRPDVPSQFAGMSEEDKMIFMVRPGVTGPASLKYRNEELFLAEQADPERFNREVIFPDKIRINRRYIEEYSFWRDVLYLWQTFFKGTKRGDFENDTNSRTF